jgi:hypothetical protein
VVVYSSIILIAKVCKQPTTPSTTEIRHAKNMDES